MMSGLKKRKIKGGILLLAVLLSLFGNPQVSRADMWGAASAAALLKHGLEEARDAFVGAMLANLKIMASRLIMDRVQALLTGTSGSALYIQNYQNFIYASSQDQAKVYMDSFFNSLASGVSATTGSMLYGVKASVENEIFRQGMSAQATIDNYVEGGVQNVFDQTKGGGYKAFMETLNNPYNNPYGAYLASSQVAMSQMAMHQDVARVQASNNGGYLSVVDPKTNMIKTPAALIKDLTSFAESLPMRIMAYAQKIPEVIGTMAAQILTQTIQNGISKVTQPIDNQLINVNREVNGGIQNVQTQIYNGIKFTN